MKMQNANVEFVRFDAQDVIMTSFLTGFYGLTSSSNGSILQGRFKDNADRINFTRDYPTLGLSSSSAVLAATSSLEENTLYVVTGVEAADSGKYKFKFKQYDDMAGKLGSAVNLYESGSITTVQEVLQWLVNNASLLN